MKSGLQIASLEYGQITEKYLQHLAKMEWDKSYAFLSDDVVFKLPDGDTGTRTTCHGLDQVKNFWDNYVANSGNDRASFTKFVHVPVEATELIENVGQTGVFNICYFSAALYYGSEVANVRMNWTFHFNDEKQIDLILTYYDRTPIIEAAKRNFLKTGTNGIHKDEMVVQIIKINSELPEEQLFKTAKERAENFKALPGLLQKYYTRRGKPGQYCGVYVWDSKESMLKFKESELASTIASAYKATGAPDVEVSEVLFQLRD